MEIIGQCSMGIAIGMILFVAILVWLAMAASDKSKPHKKNTAEKNKRLDGT